MNIADWSKDLTNRLTIDDPCREPLPELMEAGDVDDLGRLYTQRGLFVTFGRFWVRPDQARAAGYYGWRDVVLAGLCVVTTDKDGATLYLIER